MSTYPDAELRSMRERTAEIISEARRGRTKMTAERLRKVEQLQGQLTECATLAEDLQTEEMGGWVPGNPREEVTHRAEPLQEIATRLHQFVEELEGLYS